MRTPLSFRFLSSIYILFASTYTSTLVSAGAAGAAANAAAKTAKAMDFDYRFFIAGGVCAATSHGITTPIDVVKTKMQAQPEVRTRKIIIIIIILSSSCGYLVDTNTLCVLVYFCQ